MAKVLQKLGGGAFGVVYLLQLDKKNEYALKVADTSRLPKNQKAEAEAEGQLMLKHCHAHLVQCCAFFLRGQRLYLVTELCHYGTLKNFIKDRTLFVKQTRVLTWLGQMTDALRYLHVCKVIHRDMKPDNVFLDDKGNVKVGDLGIARVLDYTAQKADTIIGTYVYMSPEILHGLPYTYKTDIWSLGCCIHEVMTLCPTFSGRSLMELITNVTEGEIPPMPEYYSEKLRKLVCKILDRKEDTRPDALEILHYVSQIQGHPYRSGEHVPLGRIEINEKAVCKAVEEYAKRLHVDDMAPSLRQLHLDTSQSESSGEEEDSDNDTVVEKTVISKPRPLPQARAASHASPAHHKNGADAKKEKASKRSKDRNGMRAASFTVNQQHRNDREAPPSSRSRKSSSSTHSSSDERNNSAYDPSLTLQSSDTESEMSHTVTAGMSSKYMDLLTKESRQWLRTRFAPKDDKKHSVVQTSDYDSSSDSESLVTLYTRAQKVRYDNRKAKSRRTQTGTEWGYLESEVAPDVIKAAESVIKMFASNNQSQMEVMLIHIMGFRDYAVHGKTLMDRVLQRA